MHTAVSTIAKVARDAIVENSNGNNEGNFKNTMHDATYKMACKDPSTYLHHYAMNSRTHCAKMIDQLRDLQQRVDEANKRKMMNHIKSETGEIDDDEDNGVEDIDEQYQELQDYAASQGGQNFVSKATFKKWMDPVTRVGRKVKKHSAWEVIKAYVKEHMLGIQDNDSEDENVTADEAVSIEVPSLPKLDTADGYYEISEDSILKVMADNPTADNVGELVTSRGLSKKLLSLRNNHNRGYVRMMI
eukprot:scaffold134177_cov80-Cyclotella_meneghiniana.AAC.3